MSRLSEIQHQLRVGKTHWNDFGKYKYRTLEDILSAVKKLLKDEYISIDSKPIQLGDRYYIESTVSLWDKDTKLLGTAKGYAREPETKKGMDESQITGTASSYATKYAACNLFAIDDGVDPDVTNTDDAVAGFITEDQVATMKDLLKEVGGDEKKLLAYLDIGSLEQLPADWYNETIQLIESKRGK